jgi:hypothetical protein
VRALSYQDFVVIDGKLEGHGHGLSPAHIAGEVKNIQVDTKRMILQASL